MGHHLFTTDKMRPRGVTRFYSFLFGFLSGSLWFYRYNFVLNGLVSTLSEISRCYLGCFVPYRCELIRAGISPVDIPSFTYDKIWRQEFRVPNIYIREERAVYKESLAKGLPSGVHRVHTENEMGCPELPVPINKNLRT